MDRVKNANHEIDPGRAATGIVGLDDVLGGGFPRNRMYLIQGSPGVGKTTQGLQFLLDGAARGETVMYITLSETAEELHGVAHSHGWSLDGIYLHEHSAGDQLQADARHTIFHPSEVDLTETIKSLLTIVEEVRPTRIVFDSLSELRLLAGDALRYRREILSLKHYFAGQKCTVLLLDDLSGDPNDQQLQSLCHGVISLEQAAPDYGAERRRMRVVKMRGLQFRGGFHDFCVDTGGLRVYPRLIAAEHRNEFLPEVVPSGIPQLDSLLGGGMDRGASAIFLGPSGVGKSTIATKYAVTAAERGERAALFCFDEGIPMLFARSRGLGIDLASHVESGQIIVQPVDPAELTPGEFVHIVRQAVERDGARTVVIDSLTGYLNAMPEERFLLLILHEMLTYLGQMGVTTLLIMTQHGLMGNMSQTIDVSYLADTVLLFRYYEFAGEVRQAISVFKRRGGAHERTIRELCLGGPAGVTIGEPLRQFRGVFTGVPIYEGSQKVEQDK